MTDSPFASFLRELGTSPAAWMEAKNLVRKGELTKRLEAA